MVVTKSIVDHKGLLMIKRDVDDQVMTIVDVAQDG